MKLSNLGKIAAGVIIFILLITIPLWYGKGKTFPQPPLSLDTPAIAQLKEIRCIEDAEFMRANHMKLLGNWRDEAVRDGKRLYTARDGRVFEKSLSGTCIKCHSNKQQFCDRCHNYVGAKPNCFSCHIIAPLQKAPDSSQSLNSFIKQRDVAFWGNASDSFRRSSTAEVRK